MDPTETTFTAVDHLQVGWDSLTNSSGRRAYLEVECVIREGTLMGSFLLACEREP